MSALTKTDFHFPGQQSVYHGKVRDVYNLGDRLAMVATDRIQGTSAQPNCRQILGRNYRHLPQLEVGHPRPYGHGRRYV